MTRCPGELELARALAVGADARLEAHLAACATCGAEWESQRAAIELARELPAELPTARRREEIRTELLARGDAPAPPLRPQRAGAFAMLGLAAAAAAAYLAIGGAPPATPAHHAHGVVHPHADARFAAESPSPDEIVRLHDGTIDVEVEPLGAGERFRIAVGAAEVEVRGTAFTVTADHDRLIAVRVAHGRVEVRAPGAAVAVLEGGQAWHEAPSPLPLPLPLPLPPPALPPAPAPRVHRAPARSIAIAAPDRAPAPAPDATTAAPPTPPPARAADELAYDDAWTQLRAGAFAPAAAAFARVVALAPDGPLADDARYWHAVALARVPRATAAIAAFRELLDQHSADAHRAEASAMLGWLLVDAHQLDEAGRRFADAADADDAAVRTSARAGLAAIAQQGRAP